MVHARSNSEQTSNAQVQEGSIYEELAGSELNRFLQRKPGR
jgi:hypothetical protein